MLGGTFRPFILFFFTAVSLVVVSSVGETQKSSQAFSPWIPKTWDEDALADLEVPLADPSHSPKDISAHDYYRIPVRPIYKSYPMYHVDKEPQGYRERLRRQKPVVLWDDGAHRPRLVTEADWIKAGEMVFNAPVLFTPATSSLEERRAVARKNPSGDLYDKNGISPFATYVVRERGSSRSARYPAGNVIAASCRTGQ